MDINKYSDSLSNEDVYKKFVEEISLWGSSGKAPSIASLDLAYAFDLQRKRLEKRNVSVNSVYKLRGEHLDNIGNAWTVKDKNNCKSKILFRSYQNTTFFKVNNKVKHKSKENKVLYLMITRLENQNSNIEYCCPNCAFVSNIKTLLSGCPGCGTRFIMDDLFPKVTNYYTLIDYAENNKTLSKIIKKWMLLGAAVGILILNAMNISAGNMSPESDSFLFYLIFNTISGGIIGAIGGYVFWALAKLFSLFAGATKSLPYLASHLVAHKKLPELMLSVDKNFSYEYFVGKILALLKIMIYCDDYNNLAVYDGEPIQNIYENIIDVQYRGVIRLNSFEVKNGFCYVGVTVFTTVYTENNGRIKKKDEKFTMTVCQSLNSLADTGFTLKNVSCKSCGGSFDATKEHNCPYCSTAYHLGNDDWVVLSFKKE